LQTEIIANTIAAAAPELMDAHNGKKQHIQSPRNRGFFCGSSAGSL